MKRTSRSSYRTALGALALLLLSTAPASANRLIPFQGRVTDGAGQPLEGVFRLTFTIYDEPTGGAALYAESHADVSVVGGQINVLLGSLTSLDDPNGDQNPADAVHFDDALKPRFLGIKIGADTNQEMVPRHELVPSFHARVADIANSTVDGSIGTDQIVDGAVTFDKLNADALEAIIPPGSIMPYGGATAPPGWVLCDGSQYEGTEAQFEKLFAAIGTAFGGDGTSFKVPDLRGQFLRGLDPSGSVDPDGASRSVGSTQGTAIVGLAGQVIPSLNSTNVGGEHDHRTINSNTNQGPLNDFAVDLNIRSNSNAQFTFPSGAHQHTIDIPASAVNVFPTSGATSTETRPKNVAVNYIVKL